MKTKPNTAKWRAYEKQFARLLIVAMRSVSTLASYLDNHNDARRYMANRAWRNLRKLL